MRRRKDRTNSRRDPRLKRDYGDPSRGLAVLRYSEMISEFPGCQSLLPYAPKSFLQLGRIHSVLSFFLLLLNVKIVYLEA